MAREPILAAMTVIASRYHLLRKLASGGMAEVWLAEQRGPGSFARRVVVKTIHAHLAEQKDLVTAFADEARLAGLLHHPHIVRVEDYGEHEGRPFLVMEHLQGHNLKQLATLANGQETTLPDRLTLQLGIQVAEALRYAHQLSDDQGVPLRVVHRDVSPQNIMLTPNGAAKLVDFGIARAATNQGETQTGTLKGKLAYLSPEQAAGKKDIDHRSDQFSLGVVLWELLVGSRLFASDSDVGTLKRVAFGDIPSLALYGGKFPRPLIQAIDRALSRDRVDRFVDCTEFAKALRVCLSELGGAYSDTDYRTWLAKIAGNLSVPKPLPLLADEAVQRTESVPALMPHNPALDPTLLRPALTDDQTLESQAMNPLEEPPLMAPVPGEEITQISATVPDIEQDLPTRVSVKVVGTTTHPSMASKAPISKPPTPTAGQSKLLLSLLVAALAGVGLFVVFEASQQDANKTIDAPTVPTNNRLENRLEQRQQLSREAFLAVVEANKSDLDRCKTRHGHSASAPSVELTIRSSGKPVAVQVAAARPKLGNCLKKVIKAWRFPAFRGQSVTHRFRP